MSIPTKSVEQENQTVKPYNLNEGKILSMKWGCGLEMKLYKFASNTLIKTVFLFNL